MNSTNFNNFKAGRRHEYIGGLVKRSPYRVQIPSSGRWHITVDMAGLRGTARSSIRRLAGALPEARQAPLSSVPSLVRPDPLPQPPNADARNFDVFVSHASEDKDAFVRPLAEALRDCNLTVWFDEFKLKIGDSLRQKIDHGLARSRFGIVVLSHAFFRKGWPNYELDGLVTKAVSGEQVLLPIWHGITKQDVLDYSPSLADKLARSTASHTIHEIAEEIADVVNNRAP